MIMARFAMVVFFRQRGLNGDGRSPMLMVPAAPEHGMDRHDGRNQVGKQIGQDRILPAN
jgi:hypothetical protein